MKTALHLRAYDYEAMVVGLAAGVYGFVGITYLLRSLDWCASRATRGWLKAMIAFAWFFVLSGPVLVAATWAALLPSANSSIASHLFPLAAAAALIVAGIREAIGRAYTSRGTKPNSDVANSRPDQLSD